jgi:type III secretion protein J
MKRLFQFLLLGLLAFTLAACSSRVELLASIPEADANEVIAALVNSGIDAVKVPGKEGMVGIRVEQAQAARAVDILRAAGLPREHFAGMGQVFQKDGLISSPLEERARYLYALSQDLSGTLSHIDGVLFARVHLVLPERGTVDRAELPASAAVFIKYQQDAPLEQLQPQVRRMVVNSIPGLSSDRVSVVLIPGKAGRSAQEPSWDSVLGLRVQAGDAGALRTVLSLLAVLTLAGLGGHAYLGWAFWWQPRQRARAAAGTSPQEAR